MPSPSFKSFLVLLGALGTAGLVCGVLLDRGHPVPALPLYSNEVLRRAILQADAMRIRTGGSCHREVPYEVTLFETQDREEIRRIAALIEVDAAGLNGLDYLCCGEPTLEFFSQGNREPTVILSSLGARALRWDDGPWSGDAELIEPSRQRFSAWLKSLGADEYSSRQQSNQRQEQIHDALFPAWLAAAPIEVQSWAPSLRHAIFGQLYLAQLHATLPEAEARIQALLTWYGWGCSPWDCPLSYEHCLHDWLLVEAPDVLWRVASQASSGPQQRGAARFYTRQLDEGKPAWPGVREFLNDFLQTGPDAAAEVLVQRALARKVPFGD